MDFTHEDSLPAAQWNRALACGLGLAPAGCASEKLPVASFEE
jgi:hypothetical protein